MAITVKPGLMDKNGRYSDSVLMTETAMKPGRNWMQDILKIQSEEISAARWEGGHFYVSDMIGINTLNCRG